MSLRGNVQDMPELPDIVPYLDALEERVGDQVLQRVRVASPFLLRSVAPPLREAEGRKVQGLRRVGKRVVFALEGDLFLVVHLMIAGRFKWREKGAKIPGRLGLAAFDFASGTLMLTEASKKKRASLHLVAGEEGLAALDPGGVEIFDIDLETFRETLVRGNHTLKRALTDPRLFSGIGNAYSDEILFRARLSPFKLGSKLDDDEAARLWEAVRQVLAEWMERLRAEAAGGFPEKVTAFRPEMAVHGKYGKPCPDCDAPVQRIVYAQNEANYCAPCQTGGKLLADRALSRLLKKDWPRSLEELEEHKAQRREP